jgi:hypothetical protein
VPEKAFRTAGEVLTREAARVLRQLAHDIVKDGDETVEIDAVDIIYLGYAIGLLEMLADHGSVSLEGNAFLVYERARAAARN